MNREQAKAILPFVQAFADGKEVQYRTHPTTPWHTPNVLAFEAPADNYRIKPKVSKYRRYMYRHPVAGYQVHTVTSENGVGVEKSTFFVKWIDKDWIEEEIPA